MQKKFIRDLLILITKDLQPLSLVDSASLRQMVLRLNCSVDIPNRRQVREKHLPELRKWVDETFVQPNLKKAFVVAITFDLWMSRKTEDLFAIVVHYGDPETWSIHHNNIGLVKVEKTDGESLSDDLSAVLQKYGLPAKVIASVKDQGANLKTCIDALDSIHSGICVEVFPSLLYRFEGTCNAHLISTGLARVFAKANQGGHKDPIDKGLSCIDFFGLKKKLQSCTTYTKKSSKGRNLWITAQVWRL